MRKRILFLLLCLTGGHFVFAQNGEPADPFITVIEVATNSKHRDTIRTTHGIADHESELLIRLNRAEIEQQMLVMQGTSRSDQRLETLYRLNSLLDMQTDILKLVNDLVKLDQTGQEKPFEKIQQLASLENEVLGAIQQDSALFMEVNNRLMEYLEAQASNPAFTFIEFVFDILNEKAETLRQSFLNDLGLDSGSDSSLLVFFRLGAFVQNKQGGYPIHVENFDTYSPQQYSQSLTFSQPVSEEEKEALAENLRTGQQLKQEFEVGKIRFQDLFQSDEDLFGSRQAYDSLKNTFFDRIQQMTASTPVDTPALQMLRRSNLDLQQVEIGYSLVQTSWEVMANGFTPGSTTIQQAEDALGRLERLVDSAYRRYDRSLLAYNQETSQTAARPSTEMLSSVDQAFANYREQLKADVSKLKTTISRALGILNPLKKNTLANDRFSEQVKRFTLGNLPGEGIITLQTTGARPGEDIVIRAVLQRGRGPRDRYFEERPLSRRVIRLERVSPHIKMSGSLILANPYNRSMTSDTISLASNFQFAPSYTIFMSWGSRRSRFYNQFLGFGLGLGFSSPDFNLDGTPEFGVSAMATVFQDIISAGWGWNFGVDTPYWYVGFNIPFTVGGIPNLGTSQAISR